MRIPSGVTDQYICATCGKQRLAEDFGKDSHQSRGLKYSCKSCTNSKRRGRYKTENRGRYLHSKYGITQEIYETLYDAQRGRCAICNLKPEGRLGRYGERHRPLYVDHCHSSGAVRGLLCHNCNVAIGLMADNVSRLKSAITYMESKI